MAEVGRFLVRRTVRLDLSEPSPDLNRGKGGREIGGDCSMSTSLPPSISWALQKNPNILPILLTKYPYGHTYWNYLDGLVSSLLNAQCKGIQEKFADVDNSNKFESACSELEIARLLIAKGKQVQLLPDSYMVGPSPDLLATDPNGQAYVEVTRFNEDELVEIIIEDLRQFLRQQPTPYQVDVSIPDDLSVPATGYRLMQAKKDRAKDAMDKFKQTFTSSGTPPSEIIAEDITFTVTKSTRKQGGPGFINSAVIIVPSHQYVDRIRYLVTWKARKRESWTGDHLKKWYFIAIDTKHVYLEEDDPIKAVLGYTVTERIFPEPEVNEAARKGWGSFLEQVHLIPKDRTYFASRGVFLSNPICKNVNGLIVRKDQNAWFVPNPFAADEINDSRLATYI
jgi:hypothetical protein